MALFKIFRGKESDLNSVNLHEGYAYFCQDTGNMFIDVAATPGSRLQINAYAADALRKYTTTGGTTTVEYIDVDDLLLADAKIDVEHGGTGRETLTLNALLIGNGTDEIKMVKIDNNKVLLGDSTDGIKGVEVDDNTLLVGDSTNGIKSVGINNNEFVLGDSTNGVKGVDVSNNNVLLGDITNGVKGVEIEDGSLVIGDGVDGIKGIKGAGVLQAETAGQPKFDVVGVPMGGTGKTTVTAGALLKGNGTNAMEEITGAVGVLFALTANSPEFGTATVPVGGTGKTTLIEDAVILGNGTDAVKEVAKAKGVFKSDGVNAPTYGTAGLDEGGTGAITAAGARTNLGVYSKTEVDNEISKVSSKNYQSTLYAAGWAGSTNTFQYTYNNTNLTAKVPPIISCISNKEDYAKIKSAEATEGVGIVFTANEKPLEDIDIIIIDVK